MASISPSLRVFCLYGRALLENGSVTAYGLVTTLDISIRCNIAIRLESIHYALVAYDIKYVHLLVITLGLIVCCNTAIRPESVCCALRTRG